MRSREDIEREIGKVGAGSVHMVEVLLDIRELLQNPPVEVGEPITCPECQFEQPRYPHEKYPHHKDCSRAEVAPPEKDELFDRVAERISSNLRKGMIVTAARLRRDFGISYARASTLIDQLQAAGVISAPDPITHRRKVI